MRASPRGCVDRTQDIKRTSYRYCTIQHKHALPCAMSGRVAFNKKYEASCTHLRDLQDEQAAANEADIQHE